jgi:ribosomal-protein-alanine N-acetyltransferase
MTSLQNVWPLKLKVSFPAVRLHGERVFLRPPDPVDWEDWMRVRDRSANYLIPYEPAWADDALSREAYMRRISQQSRDWKLGLSCSFLIFRKDDQAILGGINMNNIARGAAQFCSLGYWLGEEFQSAGYMAEAMRLVLAYGFDTLGLHRVNAATLPHNGRSIKLLRRLGFNDEGFAKAYLQINGQWQDHLLFGLTEDDYRGRVVIRA